MADEPTDSGDQYFENQCGGTENSDHPSTRLVHTGTWRSEAGELSEAIFLTQSYRYRSAEEARDRFSGDAEGFIYSRYSNPSVAMFEARMADLEGVEAALATSSGMAAVSSALLSCVSAGDHVVASRELFGSCLYVIETLLPQFGVQVTLVKGTDLSAWKSAITSRTRMVFFETPTNPTLEILDIQAICDIAHAHSAIVIVDNVFATPLWQRPTAFGADVVVYSATKHIDGQGRCLAGIVLGTRDYIENSLTPFLRHVGPSLSPFNAWIMLKSLETLPLRVQQQTCSAEEIANWLYDSRKLNRVIYPHHHSHPSHELARTQMERGSTLVSFEVPGGREGAFAFCNALKTIQISNNLGDSRSLIVHPATTTHHRLSQSSRNDAGITEGLLRLSTGIEHVQDLKADLNLGLAVLQS